MTRKYYETPAAECLIVAQEKTFLDSLKFGGDNKPGSLDRNDIVNYDQDF